MTTFEDMLPKVYKLLQDPAQFAYTNSNVAEALNTAVRDIANKLGSADTRVELDLVQGTAEYLLPVGIRRINSVFILPPIQTGGTQGNTRVPLLQVNSLQNFPIVSVSESEPFLYVLSAVAGTDEDQMQIILFPTPQRTATDAIIINVGIEYIFTSENPASATDLAQIVPFPVQYNRIMQFKAAAAMLAENIDESDIARGIQLENQADEWLKPMLPIKSTQSYASFPRAFP